MQTLSAHAAAATAAAAAEELSSTRQLWDAAAAPADRPLIIFNGELDRLRGGYYPGAT
jgi:hypothetical protein